jgi:hypothetical protein
LCRTHANTACHCRSQAGETRCFLEELPQDTIVVGHYKAEEWAVEDDKWIINDRLGIQITVDVRASLFLIFAVLQLLWSSHLARAHTHRQKQPVLMRTLFDSPCNKQETETEERIVNTRGAPEGKFVFTSHVAGDHSICLKSNYTGGWVSERSSVLLHDMHTRCVVKRSD